MHELAGAGWPAQLNSTLEITDLFPREQASQHIFVKTLGARENGQFEMISLHMALAGQT